MIRPTMMLAAMLAVAGSPAAAQDMPSQLHASAADGRAVLELTPAERAMILGEMRTFLVGVQKLTGALAHEDMMGAAEAARGLGQVMVHELPPGLRAKLPQEFRQLGFSVHREFDQIALDAEGMKDVSHSLSQLAATLQKCVACHASYQIRSKSDDLN